MLSSPSTQARVTRMAALAAGLVLGMAAGSFSSVAVASSPTTAGTASKTTKLATKPAAKPAAKKARSTKHAKVLKPDPIKFLPLADASPEQINAASHVLVGRYECEFGKTISIDRNDTNIGYFNVRHGRQNWVLQPELSPTGATRLKDPQGEVLLIQILTKSMLMNTRTGNRLVDGCVHEVQRAAEAELQRQPPRPSMLAGATAP